MDNWNEGSRGGKGEDIWMNELKIINFKYGDWRDWFISQKKKLKDAKKSLLTLFIGEKRISIMAPVNISEMTLLYISKHGIDFSSGVSLGYREYRIQHTHICSDHIQIIDGKYIVQTILMSFTGFEFCPECEYPEPPTRGGGLMV